MDILDSLKSACNSACEWFTGEDDAKKASAKFRRYRKAELAEINRHDECVDRKCREISKRNDEISEIKVKFNKEYAPKFERLSSRFGKWEVERVKVVRSVLSPKFDGGTGVTKDEVLDGVNFEDEPIWTNLKAALSAGFYTRYKAKDALRKANEYSSKVKQLEAQHLAEESRMRLIVTDLGYIVRQLRSFAELYSMVLDEVDYAVNLLEVSRGLITGAKAGGGELDCRFLPRRHLAALMAADMATRIMHEMVSREYVTKKFKNVGCRKEPEYSRKPQNIEMFKQNASDFEKLGLRKLVA